MAKAEPEPGKAQEGGQFAGFVTAARSRTARRLRASAEAGRRCVIRQMARRAGGERGARRSQGRIQPVYRSQEASCTIHFTSSPNEMPANAANSGASEVSVMPGCVLTSSTTISPVPPGRSS